MAKYIVETRFSYGWENVWTEDEKPLTFPSREAAELAAEDLLSHVMDLDPADYRIVKTLENSDLIKALGDKISFVHIK